MFKDKSLALVVAITVLFFTVPVINFYAYASPERQFMYECAQSASGGCVEQWAATQESYSAVLVTTLPNGDVYDFVVDFNLSYADCIKRIQDFPEGDDYTCELQEVEY